MEKFLSWNFAILLLLMVILLIIHEYGHYLAYRVLGYKAILRRSILVPGVDPLNTIQVKKVEGLLIALGGFVLSTTIVVIPLIIFQYRLWLVLLIGSLAGSIVDFIWAFSMLFKRAITISGSSS